MKRKAKKYEFKFVAYNIGEQYHECYFWGTLAEARPQFEVLTKFFQTVIQIKIGAYAGN